MQIQYTDSKSSLRGGVDDVVNKTLKGSEAKNTKKLDWHAALRLANGGQVRPQFFYFGVNN